MRKKPVPMEKQHISTVRIESDGPSGATLVAATDGGGRAIVTITTPGYDIGRSLTAVVRDRTQLRKLAKLFTRAAQP